MFEDTWPNAQRYPETRQHARMGGNPNISRNVPTATLAKLTNVLDLQTDYSMVRPHRARHYLGRWVRLAYSLYPNADYAMAAIVSCGGKLELEVFPVELTYRRVIRPRSMKGGDLHWIWSPYALYQEIDYVRDSSHDGRNSHRALSIRYMVSEP